MGDKETVSPTCCSCGTRAEAKPVGSGNVLWARLPREWCVGVRRNRDGTDTLVFACSESCAMEMGDLEARAARASAPFMDPMTPVPH